MPTSRSLVVLALFISIVSACDGTGPSSVRGAPSPALSLGLGYESTCALTDAGVAYCWGENTAGQLGNGTATSSPVPVAVSGGLVFREIAVGYDSACGLTKDGTAYCWGDNQRGELGIGTMVGSDHPVPVSGQLRFASLGAGYRFVCGLTMTQLAYCWGQNDHMQLGVAGIGVALEPVLVPTGAVVFQKLSVGLGHVCGLTAARIALCWGWNQFSQLGDGTSATRAAPLQVGGGLTFTSITAGATTTCGIAGGVAYCWGADFFGSLAQGTTQTRPDLKFPSPVVGGISFADIQAARGNAVFSPGCGVGVNKSGYCWGGNSSGQLGTTATPNSCTFSTQSFGCSGTPLPVTGTSSFRAIVPGASHVCGITTVHTVLCWGSNASGQLGDGTFQDRSAPVVVPGFRAP